MLSLVHPEVESVLDQKNRFHSSVQGVYSTTEKLSNAQLGTKAIHALMCNLWPQVDGRLRETLPDEVIREYGLVPLRDALYNINFPTSASSSIFCNSDMPAPRARTDSCSRPWAGFSIRFITSDCRFL